jgi:proline iminopeptidase
MARCTTSPARILTAFLAASAVTGCARPADEPPVSEGLRPINGTELYVKQMGAGDPIVVVHGGPVLEHGYLLPHLRPLAQSHELIFYDQRLSGRSAGHVDSSTVHLATFVEDIEALRVSLGLDRIVLMGHSWGGLLAMEYAIRHGEHLTSLVLLDPMPPSAALWQREESILATRVTAEDSLDLAALRATEAFANRDPHAVEQALLISFRPQFHDRARIRDLHLYVPQDYGERSRQFAHMTGDLMSFDLLDSLAQVRVPTLIVYGSDEPAAEVSGAALAARLPRARLVTIDAAGHFPFIEQPETFLAAVRAFLGESDADH